MRRAHPRPNAGQADSDVISSRRWALKRATKRAAGIGPVVNVPAFVTQQLLKGLVEVHSCALMTIGTVAARTMTIRPLHTYCA